MGKISFICYPRCGTCKNAEKWLKANNLDSEYRDITKEKPTKIELKEWISKSGLPIGKFFNTSGMLYREMNLKEKVKTSSEDELLEILSSNGMIVKRPILISGDKVLVGFKESEWAEALL